MLPACATESTMPLGRTMTPRGRRVVCSSLGALLLCVLLLPRAQAGEEELRALDAEGRAAFQARDYARAEQIARRALAEVKALYGENSMPYAQYLGYLVTDLRAQLKYEEAEAAQRRLLSIVENLRGESRDAAMSLNNLAGLLSDQGKLAEAEAVHRRALALRERLLGENHPETAATLNYLGILLTRMGKNQDAESLQRRALAIWEARADRNLIYGLSNLATVLLNQGRYAEADQYSERAVSLAESTQGPGAAAMVMSNYASALGRLNRHEEAEALLRRALAFREQSLGPAHFGVAQTLNSLAAALGSQGKYLEAETVYRRALAIHEWTQGPEHPDTATSLLNLARTLLALGKGAGVEGLARRAVAIRERVLGAEHPRTAEGLEVLAQVLVEQGENAQGLRLSRRAVEITRNAGGLPDLLSAVSRMAHLLHEHGLLEEALAYYREAAEALETMFAQTRGLPEEMRQGFLGGYVNLYRNMITLLLELHGKKPAAGFDREALAAVSRDQSRIFSELLRQAEVTRFARNPGFLVLTERRDVLQERLHALRAAGYGLSAETASARANLESQIAAAERELAATLDALWRQYPRFMELTWPRPVTVQDVQQHLLRPDEALLTFALLPGQTVVFAVTQDRFRTVVTPARREDITARIRSVRRPAEKVAETGSLEVLRELNPADLHALYADLVAPVEEVLRGSSRVLVVGDGPLNTLPLEMLVTRFGDQEQQAFSSSRGGADGRPEKPIGAEYAALPYLGGQYHFAYLPSLAALASQRLHPKPRKPFTQELVSFADPVFVEEGRSYSRATREAIHALARSQRGTAGDITIPRLKETADEARDIAAILGGRATLYLRERAQEHAAKTPDLSAARYVHFATHGFLGGEFLEVKEALEGRRAAEGPTSVDRGESQGSRAGGSTRRNLVGGGPDAGGSPLATLQGRGRGDVAQPALALTLVGELMGEDGLLTMGEVIEAMDLTADLVVLSACNTAGEGDRAANGEGFAGLTRAFMYAGAKGLLVSHWSVESRSTQALITETFRQLKTGHPALTALADARKSVRVSTFVAGRVHYSRSHPYFWAPFVYVGD